MNEAGMVEQEIVMQGLDHIDDMEAICADPQGAIYICCSLDSKKKSGLPPERRLLIRAKRTGTIITVDKQVCLYEILQHAVRKELSSPWARCLLTPEGNLAINIEGMFYRRGGLFLGIKKPLLDDTALILQIENVDRVLTHGIDCEPSVRIWNVFALKDADTGMPGGISDLCVDDDGLFILSYGNLRIAGEKKRQGNLWHYSFEHESLRLLHALPGWKPEGIALNPENGMILITFDCGRNEPSHMTNVSYP